MDAISQKSIAVLPLENLSSDPENEYFADGMTEEIINALSKIQGLKVTARTSSFVFKEIKKDVRHIGNELGVSLVLEGSVRKAGSNVRITTQLIHTDNGFHLWSENFDRKLDDIFALQDEISLLVADRIRENFGHIYLEDSLVKVHTESIQAYELYLKGRFYFFTWNLSDIEKAITCFQQSIQVDPQFDQPFFGVSFSYSLLGSWKYMDKAFAFQQAADFLDKGSQIGEGSVGQYFAQAVYHFWGSWNYRAAYHSLQKAHQLNPQDAEPLDFMAELGRSIGDFETALGLNAKGLEVNPLSLNAYFTKATLFYYQGLFTETLEVIDVGRSIDPQFELLQNLQVLCLIQLNKKEALEMALGEHKSNPLLCNMARLLHGMLFGTDPDAQEVALVLAEINRLEIPLLYPWDLYLYLHSRREEEAMDLLSEKIRAKEGQVVNFKHDPLLKPLRNSPSYLQLVEQNFPDHLLASGSISKTPDDREVDEALNKADVSRYKDRLTVQMEEEHAYTQTDITLRSLAESIDLHPNKLSWLLNEKIGKNFSDYVNGYRLKAFKEKAVAPANDHLTLLGLAYDSGFTSKSVFNDFFKKQTGKTPKAWVKEAKRSVG